MPDKALSSLAHHIDIEWLKEAHRRVRKDAAPGVDDVTAEDYEHELEGNLQRLLDAAKSGAYRAPPVRRVLIPKGDGKTRPLGLPTHEDKVLQRAVAMVLEPIYEREFYDFSSGFRPGKSAHQALDALWRNPPVSGKLPPSPMNHRRGETRTTHDEFSRRPAGRRDP